MRFVEKAEIRPGRCAVIPTIPGNHVDGFFDTGSEMPGFDNHIYVSLVAVREMARKLNWVSPETYQEALDQVAALERQIKDLEADLLEADKFASAVDVLESRDFRARKKPGRPKTKHEEAA